MIRALLKSAACGALAFARLDAWIARGRPIVLGYHRVVADLRAVTEAMPGLAISRTTLGQQLDWLGRRCRFADLDTVAGALASGETSPGRPLAAVTFDDGYRDVREHALPLLALHGIPGAVFVISDAAEHGDALLHDRLYRALAWHLRASRQSGRRPHDVTRALIATLGTAELAGVIEAIEAAAGPALAGGDARTLDWDDLRALRAAGFTIGSHTRAHLTLARRSPAQLTAELVGSRRRLEEQLGAPVVHLAYPDGQFDAAAVRAVADAGYRHAYTSCHHRDTAHPLLTIPRTMLWERSAQDAVGAFSPAVLACQTHGALPFLDRCRRVH